MMPRPRSVPSVLTTGSANQRSIVVRAPSHSAAKPPPSCAATLPQYGWGLATGQAPVPLRASFTLQLLKLRMPSMRPRMAPGAIGGGEVPLRQVDVLADDVGRGTHLVVVDLVVLRHQVAVVVHRAVEGIH